MTHSEETGGWTSASNAAADLACPGRHLACRGLPEESSPEADSGTRIHAYLAGGAIGTAATDAEIEIFHNLKVREEKLLADWMPHCTDFCIYREERLWIQPFGLEYRHSGKLDAYVVGIGRAIVYDWKTGNREPTESAKNLQLRDQAVLLWKARPDITKITVAILWPYAQPEMCEYNLEDLQRAYDDLVARVIKSNDPKSPRIPSEEACRFCRAKGTNFCPETQQSVIAVSKMEVATIPSPQLVEACLLAEPIIKLVKERARAALAENPAAIPGYELKENAPNEPITDVSGAWSRACDFGLPRNEFLDCAKLTKGELESKLKALYRTQTKRDRIPVKKWDEKWEAFLSGITTEEPKQPTLRRSQ